LEVCVIPKKYRAHGKYVRGAPVPFTPASDRREMLAKEDGRWWLKEFRREATAKNTKVRTKAPDLKDDFTPLSAIDFYPCPHCGNAPFKKIAEKIISKYETELKLVPTSNSQVITVRENEVTIKTKAATNKAK
jgi:hypothetical protein